MKLSQKRAISYAITKRDQAHAVSVLRNEWGIEFEALAREAEWKGSPVRLLSALNSGHVNSKVLKAAGLKKRYEFRAWMNDAGREFWEMFDSDIPYYFDTMKEAEQDLNEWREVYKDNGQEFPEVWIVTEIVKA